MGLLQPHGRHRGRRGQARMKRRATAKPVVVHDLDQAAAALAAAASLEVPVAVGSAPRTAIDAGVGWFSALARLAREAEPRARAVFILDCGDRADLVQEAFPTGSPAPAFPEARRLPGAWRISRASRARGSIGRGRRRSTSAPSPIPRRRCANFWPPIENPDLLGYSKSPHAAAAARS